MYQQALFVVLVLEVLRDALINLNNVLNEEELALFVLARVPWDALVGVNIEQLVEVAFDSTIERREASPSEVASCLWW